MTESVLKAKSIAQVSRLIGKIKGQKKGPTIVCFGGIHGNEPAGVKALEYIFKELRKRTFQIRGTLIGVRGNIPALLEKKRFLNQDLNRLWTDGNISEIKKKPHELLQVEEVELLEIEQVISEIVQFNQPPFYFIDFHTTSSKTPPFLTINDALINRKFSSQFPVPTILGIEEYLEGPLLSHMNKLGYVSLGFESGQHNAKEALENNIAFVWLLLVFSGMLEKNNLKNFYSHVEQLESSAKGDKNFYEVIYRRALKKTDEFSMINGYESFQKVAKGTLLAIHNKEKVYTRKNSILFMPLYQQQGAEGFFLIKNTPKWAMKVSAFLRTRKFDNLLTTLPGISWCNHTKASLLVNLKVARFFTKSFFHLLGYRNRQIDKTHIMMHNRERTAKNSMYRNELWY